MYVSDHLKGTCIAPRQVAQCDCSYGNGGSRSCNNGSNWIPEEQAVNRLLASAVNCNQIPSSSQGTIDCFIAAMSHLDMYYRIKSNILAMQEHGSTIICFRVNYCVCFIYMKNDRA